MMKYQKPRQTRDMRENGRIILAHGEATGHAHELANVSIGEIPIADFFEEPTGRRVLLVSSDAPLLDALKVRHCVTRGIGWIPADADLPRYADVEVIAHERVRGAVLKHEDHGAFIVPSEHPIQVRQGDVLLQPIGLGAWEVVRQREHAPEFTRQVAD